MKICLLNSHRHCTSESSLKRLLGIYKSIVFLSIYLYFFRCILLLVCTYIRMYVCMLHSIVHKCNILLKLPDLFSHTAFAVNELILYVFVRFLHVNSSFLTFILSNFLDKNSCVNINYLTFALN